ncbi:MULTISPECIES: hypothetical protein [unclassified Kitasatospora]|uniref:hypothetical protein n=1 Tax=unclassified Kitasatospora TaxID=2633591 RepID=UPI0038202608
MIEYELIQQQVRELHARADRQRLVREARNARRAQSRPVATRAERRATRLREC